ncbi:MAG: phosphotransferase [bacterium]|nr:phosphotransferase [bacterium]
MEALKAIESLGQKHFGGAVAVAPLLGDGSDRRLFRVIRAEERAVGVWNRDLQENQDFLVITEAMHRLGIPVPQVYCANEDQSAYLLEDLGEENLAQMLVRWQTAGDQAAILGAYTQALDWLPRIQTGLAKLLGPRLKDRQMDRAALLADLDYFEQHFVQLFGHQAAYRPQLRAELERELVGPVAALPVEVFVCRDFQARNFMYPQGKIHFLDYQSAMLGNKYYDLASMLYASKAFLTDRHRKLLLYHAYQKLKDEGESKDLFEDRFTRVLLLRRLRSLGSYGYLGAVKKKRGFLESLSPAKDEILTLAESRRGTLPELIAFLRGLG